MSNAAWEELEQKLEKDEDIPEVNEENINALLSGFRAQAGDMLNDAVKEAFEWLRPRRSKHKRNSEFEVPRRVVLTRTLHRRYGGGFEVDWKEEQKLIALENVLGKLSGRGTICKTHWSQLSNAIRLSPKGETELFFYSAYDNGNLHLTFRDTELLARFNALAGGARLRKPAVHKHQTGDQQNGNEESYEEGPREESPCEEGGEEGPREEGGDAEESGRSEGEKDPQAEEGSQESVEEGAGRFARG